MTQGPTSRGEVPVVQQLRAVQIEPFQHVTERPFGETPLDDAALDLYDDLEVAVGGVEVRRRVLPVVHANDDPEEAADLRHLDPVRSR